MGIKKELIALSPDIYKLVVNYYKFDPEKFQEEKIKPCAWFSDPSLEMHECNSRVLLPGGRDCRECRGSVDIPCSISCDIQTVCLAALAYRLGIGGGDFKKAMQRNLYKKSPDELYEEVTVVLSCGIDALIAGTNKMVEAVIVPYNLRSDSPPYARPIVYGT